MTIGFIVYFVIMYDRGFWMITWGNDSIVRMICELELNVFFYIIVHQIYVLPQKYCVHMRKMARV